MTSTTLQYNKRINMSPSTLKIPRSIRSNKRLLGRFPNDRHLKRIANAVYRNMFYSQGGLNKHSMIKTLLSNQVTLDKKFHTRQDVRRKLFVFLKRSYYDLHQFIMKQCITEENLRRIGVEVKTQDAISNLYSFETLEKINYKLFSKYKESLFTAYVRQRPITLRYCQDASELTKADKLFLESTKVLAIDTEGHYTDSARKKRASYIQLGDLNRIYIFPLNKVNVAYLTKVCSRVHALLWDASSDLPRLANEKIRFESTTDVQPRKHMRSLRLWAGFSYSKAFNEPVFTLQHESKFYEDFLEKNVRLDKTHLLYASSDVFFTYLKYQSQCD